MQNAYDSLINFVNTDASKTRMEDLGALHPIHRPKFVFDVLLSDKALAARVLNVPRIFSSKDPRLGIHAPQFL